MTEAPSSYGLEAGAFGGATICPKFAGQAGAGATMLMRSIGFDRSDGFGPTFGIGTGLPGALTLSS